MDLTRFCATAHDPRPYLRAPFRDGGNVVASNGHIMIVIPGMDGDFDAAVSSMIGTPERLNGGTRSGVMTRLSALTLPDPVNCIACGGKGYSHSVRCTECGGKGKFKHGSFWYDCKACDGEGHQPCEKTEPGATRQDCFRCSGFGEEFASFAIDGVLYQRKYLALLASLPGCYIETAGPEGIAKFTFDGGYGFLMPCRP